jgi:hypothetical protein
VIPGLADPFHHTDRSLLIKIGEPTANPLTKETKAPPG